MDNKIKCVRCGKSNYSKEGCRKTENRGKIQKYKCKECGKYFTNDNGFYRMKNSEKTITMSVDMYLSALSSRKMRNQLSRHMQTKISHISILAWVRKYVMKVHKFVNKLMPNLSGKFYADETFVDCENRNDAVWCAVDWDTRFIAGYHYSTARNVNEAVTFLRKATMKKLPKYIQTDAGKFYPQAMKKVFYSRYTSGEGKHKLKVEHIVNDVQKTRTHNVRIETVFSKLKDRVRNFRGFKALWSAPILMAGLIIQHNFIEEHTTLRDYPCERAGLSLDTGVNRWLGLIRLSCY